jgi:small subunit ribosomal protein S6
LNDYEILLLLDPELPEERQSEIVTRTRETIEQGGGNWADHQPWGRRRLAYEIDHKPDGAYHLLTFDSAPETLDEVSRVLRITDGVMRHLAVRRVKGASMRPPEPLHEEPRRESRHEEPRREEPSQEEPSQEEPRQEEPSQEEPRDEEPSQEEPRPEEPVAAAPVSSQDSEPEETAESVEGD